MKTSLPSYQAAHFVSFDKSSRPLADKPAGLLSSDNSAFLQSAYYVPIKSIRFGRVSSNTKAEKTLAKVNQYKEAFVANYPIPEEYKAFIPDFQKTPASITKFMPHAAGGYQHRLHILMLANQVLENGGDTLMPIEEIVPHEVYHCLNQVARTHLRLVEPELFKQAIIEGITERIEHGGFVGSTIIGWDTRHIPDEVKPKLNLSREEVNKIYAWWYSNAHEMMGQESSITEDFLHITDKGVAFLESKLTDDVKKLLLKRNDNKSLQESIKEFADFGLFWQSDVRLLKMPTLMLPSETRVKLKGVFEKIAAQPNAYLSEDIWGNDTLNEKTIKELENLLNQPEAKQFVNLYDSPNEALEDVVSYLNSFVFFLNRMNMELKTSIPEALKPLKDIPLNDTTRKLGQQFAKDLFSTQESMFYSNFDPGNEATHLIYSVLSPEERNARKVSYKFRLKTLDKELEELSKQTSNDTLVEKVKQFKAMKKQYEMNLKVIGLIEEMIEKNKDTLKVFLRFADYDKASLKLRKAAFRFQEVQGKLGTAVMKQIPADKLIDFKPGDPLPDVDIESIPEIKAIRAEMKAALKELMAIKPKAEKLAKQLKDHYSEAELQQRSAPTYLMAAAMKLVEDGTPSLQMDLTQLEGLKDLGKDAKSDKPKQEEPAKKAA